MNEADRIMFLSESTRFIGEDACIFLGDVCRVFIGEESRRGLVGVPGRILRDEEGESSIESASVGEEGTIFMAYGDLQG